MILTLTANYDAGLAAIGDNTLALGIAALAVLVGMGVLVARRRFVTR